MDQTSTVPLSITPIHAPVRRGAPLATVSLPHPGSLSPLIEVSWRAGAWSQWRPKSLCAVQPIRGYIPARRVGERGATPLEGSRRRRSFEHTGVAERQVRFMAHHRRRAERGTPARVRRDSRPETREGSRAQNRCAPPPATVHPVPVWPVRADRGQIRAECHRHHCSTTQTQAKYGWDEGRRNVIS